MKAYLVSYDLDKPGQDYTDLIRTIEGLGGKKCLYSEWFIATNLNSSQLFDKLSPFIDRNDRLLILGVTGEATWWNLMVPDQTVRQLLVA